MRRLLLALLAATLAAPAAIAKGTESHVLDESGQTRTFECTAEKPDVAVNGSDNTLTLTGSCNEVALNGSDNKVTIASVEKLAVNGSTNTVDIDAAGKIAVTGSDNKITWKKGTGTKKKPKVAVLGSGNSVKKAP